MTDDSHITLERASQLLDYCSETGALTWKPRGNPKFDNRFAGKVAGTPKVDGYVQIMIDGKLDYAHRIIWMFERGEHPKGMLDHINGDPSDNRIQNLRLADHAQNAWNASMAKNNKTGFKGVSICPTTGKFISQICVRGHRKNLGRYATPEEAHAAYCKAAADLHGDFSRVA